MKRSEDNRQQLLARRQHLEKSLDDLRGALRGQLGWAPRRGMWSVLLIAGAVGLTVALALKRRRD